MYAIATKPDTYLTHHNTETDRISAARHFDTPKDAYTFARDRGIAYRYIEHFPGMRPGGYRIERYRRSRFFAIYDRNDELIALTVYRKGAENIARLLHNKETP